MESSEVDKMDNGIKKIVKESVITILLLTLNGTVVYEKKPKTSEGSIYKVIKAMTIDEKAHFVVGTGYLGPNGPTFKWWKVKGDHKTLRTTR
jgi:beta-glucosidase